MGIDGFTYLGIPLKLVEPAYLGHVSSVFIFFLRVCKWNGQLWIGPCQFFKSSLYRSPGKVQSLSSLDQVKQFILASGSVPDQGTNESSSSLYNLPHRGAYILSSDPSTLSDHFTTNLVDFPPSGAWLLIIAPSGAESSIYIDSCVYSSDKKPQSG